MACAPSPRPGQRNLGSGTSGCYLILVHLRELRAELAEFREEVRSEFKRVEVRMDAMHSNGMKALKSFIGHQRVEQLEAGA
jgi:hypothetical protein